MVSINTELKNINKLAHLLKKELMSNTIIQFFLSFIPLLINIAKQQKYSLEIGLMALVLKISILIKSNNFIEATFKDH